MIAVAKVSHAIDALTGALAAAVGTGRSLVCDKFADRAAATPGQRPRAACRTRPTEDLPGTCLGAATTIHRPKNGAMVPKRPGKPPGSATAGLRSLYLPSVTSAS